MVCEAEGNDSFLRPVSCRECGSLPADASRDGGRIADQRHTTMIRAYRQGARHTLYQVSTATALVEGQRYRSRPDGIRRTCGRLERRPDPPDAPGARASECAERRYDVVLGYGVVPYLARPPSL